MTSSSGEASFLRDELRGLSPGHRRAILTALLAAAAADTTLDPREIEALKPWLDGTMWGLTREALNEDFADARMRGQALRAPEDYARLGQACAEALPTPLLREKLMTAMLGIAWADGVLAPQEQWVLGAFNQGLGLPRERADALADAADRTIFTAIARGRIETVRQLLDTGTPVTARDARQWTPLHVAVATGQLAIVDLLLERGAEVHALHGQQSPPLFLACNKPYAAIVERLLRAGAHVDDANPGGLRALQIASMMGQTAVVRALRQGGASLELVDAAHETALHLAASEGKSGTVALLIAEGARVDARSTPRCTPLHHAATSGDLATVTALIAGRSEIDAADVDGQTALHYAAVDGHADIVALLLSVGAQPAAPTTKLATPLHFAAAFGFTTCARLLLDAGAPVDARNAEGGTPLFAAAVRNRRDAYDLLVSRGADPDAATSFGTTPRGSIGAALRLKLRSATLATPWAPRAEPGASALQLDIAALATFPDYRIAAWLNVEGTPDQVLVMGNDARGRPQYVSRGAARDASDPRARWMTLDDAAGKRCLPVFTSDAAAEAFRKHTKLMWPESGMGLAHAVTSEISAAVFRIADLPVDGIVLDPFGPAPPRLFSVEECSRVARLVRGQ